MKIKYIIDYKGYGEIFQYTNIMNGECYDIDRKEAEDLNGSDDVWSSGRADVSLGTVSQKGTVI